MTEHQPDNEQRFERPTPQRWRELLKQLGEQLPKWRLDDEDWVRAHQVTPFEYRMLVKAQIPLGDLRGQAHHSLRTLRERHGDLELPEVLGLMIDDEKILSEFGLGLEEVAGGVEGLIRTEDLLDKVAEALRDYRDPFDPTWLSAHGFTEAQRKRLCEIVAKAVYGYLVSPPLVWSVVEDAATLRKESQNPNSPQMQRLIDLTVYDELRKLLKLRSETTSGQEATQAPAAASEDEAKLPPASNGNTQEPPRRRSWWSSLFGR